jgi:ribosomal protein S14
MPIKNPGRRRGYFRELMRRRRAGIKPEPEPDHAAIDQGITHWIDHPHRPRPAWAERVLDAIKGLDLHTGEGSSELARIYQAARHGARDARKGKREEEARQEAEREAEREINRQRCSLCRNLPSADRLIVPHGRFERVCEHCIEQAAAKVAAMRAEDRTKRQITRCAFCGRVRAEVRAMVQGLDRVCICDECAAQAVKAAAAKRRR